MMRRDDCLKALARHHTDEIVVPVYQAAFEWMVIKPHPLTYLGTGAMGQASSHALGLAGDEARIAPAFDAAWERSRPYVFLVTRTPE